MERHDWVLATLAATGDEPLTPVQLQKSLFLLAQGRPKVVGKGFYQFRPYSYGPFDSSVYHDAEALAEEGLVTISRPNLGTRQYRITTAGTKAAKALDLTTQARNRLKKIVDEVTSLSRLIGAHGRAARGGGEAWKV